MTASKTEPCASGVNVIAMREAMEELVGASVVAAAIERLPAEVRREYLEATPLSWVRMTTSWQVVDAVAAEAGRDPERLYDEAARRGIERSFKTVWRVLLRFTSDQALVARTAVIFNKSRNVGDMTSRIVGPGRAESTITGWPGMKDRHIRGITISMEAVLTLAGRRGVRVTATPTRDGASFQARWSV